MDMYSRHPGWKPDPQPAPVHLKKNPLNHPTVGVLWEMTAPCSVENSVDEVVLLTRAE
jgi:hypothetical protein